MHLHVGGTCRVTHNKWKWGDGPCHSLTMQQPSGLLLSGKARVPLITCTSVQYPRDVSYRHVTLFTVPRGTRRSSWLVRTFIILKCCWKHYIKVSISLRHFIKGQGKLLSKTQSTNTGEQFIFYDTFSRDLRDLRAIQLCIIQIRLFTRTLVLVHITITM